MSSKSNSKDITKDGTRFVSYPALNLEYSFWQRWRDGRNARKDSKKYNKDILYGEKQSNYLNSLDLEKSQKDKTENANYEDYAGILRKKIDVATKEAEHVSRKIADVTTSIEKLNKELKVAEDGKDHQTVAALQTKIFRLKQKYQKYSDERSDNELFKTAAEKELENAEVILEKNHEVIQRFYHSRKEYYRAIFKQKTHNKEKGE